MEHEPQQEWLEDIRHLQRWARDVFLFANETMGILPSEPLDELRGVAIPYTDAFGIDREALLFDQEGNLVYHDLAFYTIDMFKNQSRADFKAYKGTRFTWQQTVILEAYNRAVNTFDKDSFDIAKRWISTRSGHGIGKTGTMSVIAIHFLICFPGAQIGMTSNSEQQVQDIFMKEFFKWRERLPEFLRNSLEITSDHIRVEGSEDWFLRAQVARPERPEALAGLHGEYVLILVDEASGVSDKVFEVMKGALTGDNYIVGYWSNPTRNEGEFFQSHKPGSLYTKLNFSSRDSPIVKEGYIEKMEADYPSNGDQPSDEVLIRVDGEFAGTTVMDEKGWIPLFANVTIHFEAERGQIINGGVIAVDPAGAGKDSTSVGIRDNVYLKEVLHERTSNPKDLARKVETVRDAYNCKSEDIGVEAFGVGVELVANINTKLNDSVHALLTGTPREGTEHIYNSWKTEMAWLFRQWLIAGGIIITNHKSAWMKELERIKYKRDPKGRIVLMDKVTFKKEYGFSPDRFDMAIHTFFKAEASRAPTLTKNEKEAKEATEFMAKVMHSQASDDYSSL